MESADNVMHHLFHQIMTKNQYQKPEIPSISSIYAGFDNMSAILLLKKWASFYSIICLRIITRKYIRNVLILIFIIKNWNEKLNVKKIKCFDI